MNAPSVDIAGILAAASIGLTIGANLYVHEMPPTPDKCVCIYDTGGFDANDNLDKTGYARPTVQITVRSDKGEYRAAYTLAESIKDALHLKTNTVQGGTTYMAIYLVGDINSIGFDDNHRSLITINFRIDRTS